MATGVVENEKVPAAETHAVIDFLPTILFAISAVFAVLAIGFSTIVQPNITGIFVVLAAYSFFASHQLDKGDTNAV